MAFVSCDNGRNADDRLPDINDFVEGEDHSVLVAYFSEPLPESGANMVEGYSISRSSVQNSADGIRQWLVRIGMLEQ